MKHYPVYLSVKGQRIALAGGGEAAVAKLIEIYAEHRVTGL